jgi:hypothetical protein
VGADGTDPGGEPFELTEARLIVGLYERFGYHPALLDESAELLQHLRILDLAGLNGGADYE